MSRKILNWQRIKTEYITNPDTTLAILAKKNKVSTDTIGRRCTREKWVDLRKEHQSRLQSDLPKLTAQLKQQIIETTDNKHLQYSQKLQDLGIKAIKQNKWYPKSFKEAKETILDGVALERKILNIDTPEQVTAIQINFGSDKVKDYAK